MKAVDIYERHLHSVGMRIEDAPLYNLTAPRSPRDRMARQVISVRAKTVDAVVGPDSEWFVDFHVVLIKRDGERSLFTADYSFHPDRDYPQPVEDAIQLFLDETGIKMEQVRRWNR